MLHKNTAEGGKTVLPAQMAELTRAVYDGRLVVGKDLMSIVVAKSEVTVKEPAK